MEANGEVTKIDNRMQLVFCILLGLLKKNFFNLEDHRIGFSFFKVFCLLNLPATLRLSIHATVHQGFVRLFVLCFIRSFVRSFVRSLFHPFVRSFVCLLFVCPFIGWLARSVVCSFVRCFFSSLRSRSFARLLVRLSMR